MKKLTKQEVEDRLWVFDSIVSFLEAEEWATDSEREQANVLKDQVQKWSVRFHNKVEPIK